MGYVGKKNARCMYMQNEAKSMLRVKELQDNSNFVIG